MASSRYLVHSSTEFVLNILLMVRLSVCAVLKVIIVV